MQTGGYGSYDGSYDGNYLASILKFDPTSLSWNQIGRMTKTRAYHGVSVVRAADVEQFCV